MNIITIVLTAVVVLAFGFFSIVKIAGVPKALFEEQKAQIVGTYGISRNAMRLIGIAELLGALLVLAGLSPNFTPFAQVGNIILMVVTAGAMSYHSRYDSVTKDGLPAIIQFALNAILLILSFMM